jgi:type IV pilus assembly protein PilA
MSFSNLITRRRDEEDGFTLIELMVVVLIIAILIAIAIPTFLGARARAQDRAAQSDLRNGLTAEKTVYTDLQVYVADETEMQAVESSLNWNDINGTGLNVLNVSVSTSEVADDTVCLDEESKSGEVFRLVDIAAGADAGTYYERGVDCAAGNLTTNGGW